ncbi:MAG: type II secretion system F family protein, partial [Halobacteriales archaeon]|nr:type II secretion system F family protein [Halobacteriales archaeon]
MAEAPAPAPGGKRERSGVEATFWVLLVVGMLAAPAGAAAWLVLTGYELSATVQLALGVLMALSPLLLGAAVAVAHPIDRLRRASKTAGKPMAEARMWTRLKVGGLLLNLLGIIAAVVLVFAILVRFGAVQNPVAGYVVPRGLLVLLVVFALSHGYTLYAMLRLGVKRQRSGIRAIVMAASLVAVGLLGGIVVVLAMGQGHVLGGTIPLEVGDVPFLVLGAQAAASLALASSRGLPSITGLLEEGRLGQTGITTTRRGVFLPVFAAFALLFLVFLLFIFFGVGVVGIAQQVARSPLLLAVIVFLALAFLGSILGAFSLARQESGEIPLYRKPTNAKRRRELWILGTSLAIALLVSIPLPLLIQGYDVGFVPASAWIDVMCLSLLVAIGPYGFYQAREHRRIRTLEERFPDFLRDIASSHKGGLTLTQAAVIASRGEYGPLTPEVKKMSDQLNWNVSFNEALQRFSDRVQTPLVQRAVSLILQANKSGGATTEVLLAAARDAREIKTLEQERKVSMSLYTVVIYVTFFVFLGV